MRCLHCDYTLFNLTTNVCPECGHRIDLETYRFGIGDVSFHCPFCDQQYFGNDEFGLPTPRQFVCVTCQRPVSIYDMRVAPEKAGAEGLPRWGVPWDRRQQIGMFAAWWQTFKMVAFKPKDFYTYQRNTDFYDAWLFAAISTAVGIIPAVILQLIFQFVVMGAAGMGGGAGSVGPGAALGPGIPWLGTAGAGLMILLTVGTILVTPLLGPLMGSAIYGGMTHLALKMMGSAKEPFNRTFILYMYSYGAFVFRAVPLCGGWIAGIWQLVVTVIGVMRVHRVGAGMALLCIFLLLLLLVILGVVIGVAMMVALS